MPHIKTNGIKTYYEIKGRGNPLVFIHGITNTRDVWNPQLEYFSDKFKVVTYDVRGHGKSEGNSDEYSMTLFANDLNELLRKLKLKNPIICGLSMGGMIAQLYATLYPVRLLILVDTFKSGKLTEFIKFLPKTTVERIAMVTPINLFLELTNLTLLKNTDKATKEKVKHWFEKMASKDIRKTLLACYNFGKIDTSKIKTPTLIISGENETPITKVTSKCLRNEISNAKFFEIKNSGHLSNLENPIQFNEILSLFFSENP